MSERLVLRNVRMLDGSGADIVVNGGVLEAIAPPGTGQGESAVDCSGRYVSSGWIDLHAHACSELQPYGDEIDEIGVRQGVTTLVDAGSCGSDRIGELAREAQNAQTRLLAFLNVSRIGLERIDELSELDWIDQSAAAAAAAQYGGFIVGLKARISASVVGSNGIEPLRLARLLGEELKLPLMVHIGSGPPPIDEVMALLRKGDVVTHYLNGKRNNLFHEDGRPRQALSDAIGRGVRLDVGHGTASFSFPVAESARAQGIHPDTISTDIYRGNRLNGPVYSMSSVLTKFLQLGYSLEETVERVTVRPAAWLNRPELGRMTVGEPAELTLFEVNEQPSELMDSEGNRRTSRRTIQAKGVVRNGEYLACQIRPETGH